MTSQKHAASPLNPNLLTIEEARELLRISRWGMYNLINDGRVPTLRIGRKRFIAAIDFEALVEDLREVRHGR